MFLRQLAKFKCAHWLSVDACRQNIQELIEVATFEDNFKNSKEMAKKVFGKNNQRQTDTYYFNIFKEFEGEKDNFSSNEEKTDNSLKNYYLVIDEINRGNISKIFGELITLIEDDKRDNLSVELPYSRKKFTVPSNLYIIATMNTTDKSIALLDVALRRRFTFLKMKPDLKIVKNEKARDLMKKLNEKISEKLGEDYLIGHGYFTDIQDEEDLEFVKKYKILPLLEEYFYGDDENFNVLKEIVNENLDE